MDMKPLSFGVMLGSLRKGSYNAALVRALPKLAPEGVSIEVLPSYREFPLYDADIQAEGIPAAVERLGQAVRAADGIVIVTPEYNYSVPGGLKNAIDWLSRLKPQPFAGKPVAIQSASPSPIGGTRAQLHLRQILVYLDALAFTRPEVIAGVVNQKVDEAGELVDEATRGFIAQQLDAFAKFVRRLSQA